MNDAVVENSKLSLKQRYDLLKRAFLKSNINLIEEKDILSPFKTFVIKYNDKTIKLNVVLKNVTNSGWSEKYYIKRIQVSSIKDEDLPSNSLNTLSMFLGIANLNGLPIFICWNPFLFKFHKTNRSCYINVNHIVQCLDKPFISVIDSKMEVLLCSENGFAELIDHFIEKNSIE